MIMNTEDIKKVRKILKELLEGCYEEITEEWGEDDDWYSLNRYVGEKIEELKKYVKVKENDELVIKLYNMELIDFIDEVIKMKTENLLSAVMSEKSITNLWRCRHMLNEVIDRITNEEVL